MTGKIPYYRATEIAEKSWKIENACCESSYALCYLVEGRDYALLIDTILGIGNLKAFCETLTDKPIRLVNTHSHSDHVGGNSSLTTAIFIPGISVPSRTASAFRRTKSWKWQRRWSCRNTGI